MIILIHGWNLKEIDLLIFLLKENQKNLKILTGNFYFKNENIYKNCFINYPKSEMNEIYIDNIIKVAKKLQMKISVMEDDIYINLEPSVNKRFHILV